MIELSVMLIAGFAPQIVPLASEAVLLGRATRAGRLQLSALGLGDGGVRARGVAVRRRSSARRSRGRFESPGGVLVRTHAAGVKLDFPSGRELMVTPSGRVHLRGGGQTLPFFRGVRLVLADGTVVTAIRANSPRRPLAAVNVESRGRVRQIWSETRRTVNASHTAAFAGATVLVLGDGGCLYLAATAGPVIALERVLCPKAAAGRYPARRVVIVGDVLAASLELLPAHAPRKSVQFPQVAEAARRFAALGPLFSRHVARLPGAVGELWFPLASGYRLKLATTSQGMLVLGLYRGSSSIPGVEWNVTWQSTIHFVRPGGGLRGGPRYFMRGVDLAALVQPLLPRTTVGNRTSRVAGVVTKLGGRMPKQLEIRRRSR